MRYASVYLTGGISSMALSFVLMSFQKNVTKMRKKLSHFWAHVERTIVMYYTEKNETKSIVSMVV